MVLTEVLLAASGHHSSLDWAESTPRLNTLQSRLSPSENALINRITNNGLLLSTLKIQAREICSIHPSTICRAVASAVLSPHLTSFQEHLIKVEQQILQNDPQFVGAHGIVPLSGIVASLDGWPRRLDWLQRLMIFVHVDGDIVNGNLRGLRSGAQLINWLRRESQTGYPDIESLILQLIGVAESSWLRQTSMWLLYGDLPSPSQHADFFIQLSDQTSADENTGGYVVLHHFAPEFLTRSTARSIRFIGASLNHMKDKTKFETGGGGSIETWANQELITKHLKLLSDLQLPLTALHITQVVTLIRTSLAQTALQSLLPTGKIVRILSVLFDFSLMNCHEFAPSIVSAADEYLAARNAASEISLQPDARRLQGVMIRHGELKSLLSRAITLVAARSVRNMGREPYDENLEIARDWMSLSVRKNVVVNPMISEAQPEITNFDDILIGTPAALTLELDSPMTLILSHKDITIYSRISFYLLSIRRAHMHLTDSWRLNTLRRNHIRRLKGSRNARANQNDLNEGWDKVYENSVLLRSTWTTMSSASFFFAQLSIYLHEEVLANSWINFRRWLEPNAVIPDSASSRDNIFLRDYGGDWVENRTTIQDPETIAIAHRQYLSGILSQIFLSDTIFANTLRILCSRVDTANSLMSQINSAAEVALAASGSPSSARILQSLSSEDVAILRSLRETEIGIRDSLKVLLARLKSLDSDVEDRSDSFFEPGDAETTGFVPWRSLGIGSLLVKLGLGEDDWLGENTGLIP